jgi:hypothetical protein
MPQNRTYEMPLVLRDNPAYVTSALQTAETTLLANPVYVPGPRDTQPRLGVSDNPAYALTVKPQETLPAEYAYLSAGSAGHGDYAMINDVSSLPLSGKGSVLHGASAHEPGNGRLVGNVGYAAPHRSGTASGCSTLAHVSPTPKPSVRLMENNGYEGAPSEGSRGRKQAAALGVEDMQPQPDIAALPGSYGSVRLSLAPEEEV